jgi:aldose 1-epimerase
LGRQDNHVSDFRVSRARLGIHDVAVLDDRVRGRCVRIARRGATVLGIEVTDAGVRRDVADGYRDAAELEQRSGSRFAVMAPFANRIADARYTFAGAVHDLQPDSAPGARAARHGFVRDVDFELAGLAIEGHAAQALFTTAAIRPGVHPGYPFAIDLALRYTLDARGLSLEATLENVGTSVAPCFFGWHPYFRVGDGPADTWELEIPAATVIRTDADYIPLPGPAARVPLDRVAELDFRRAQPIGARELNHGYADLSADADGRMRTRLRDPDSGLALALWQESGVLLAFTADTVNRDARRSVALEPMESFSNAFNRPDCAHAIALAPGAQRLFRCGVQIQTR